ncbi:hypothetical protein MRB53_016906 [Persea americana]|uniref:Uncharacterized protein n=1 Tax=Persea americana TaxID=3435 RepID=A0ACC2M377_PERAE|nr:hypothetical protein MRB53_016906 [Persea americana]
MAMAGVAADLLLVHPLQEDFEEGIYALNSFICNDIDPEIHFSPPEFHDFHSIYEPIIPFNHARLEEYLGIEDDNPYPTNIDFQLIEDSDPSFFDCHDQVSLALHLFDQCSQRTDVVDRDSETNPFREIGGGFDFGVFSENDEMGSNLFEMGLGLGGVFREADEMSLVLHTGELSQVCVVEPFSEGLTIVGFGSDGSEEDPIVGVGPFSEGLRIVGFGSDSEEDSVVGVDLDLNSDLGDAIADDMGISLHMDGLQLQERRDLNGDFEWEDVDVLVDQGTVLSMMVSGPQGESLELETSLLEMGNTGPAVEDMRNLEWEVLWPVNGLDRNPIIVEHNAEFNHAEIEFTQEAAEYEILLGQFVDDEDSLRSSPTAANSVVANLQTVVLTREDAENNNTLCAVCMDGISVGGQAKRLPCSHLYHVDCILPWLRIRNTCPVCRCELPTDDCCFEQ